MYIFIDENNNIGFKTKDVHEITENDVLISDEIYSKYFEYQKQGKQFKIKDIKGNTFDEIFEEVTPVIVPQMLSIEDRVSSIESALTAMLGV
jgi:hypothetical protein